MILVVLAALGMVTSLAVLTGVGAYRRSKSTWKAVASAATFPLAWISWYVLDELLRRPVGRADAPGSAP